MSRSRSSFDLSGAIATAASLSVPEEQPGALYRRVPLVSFGPTASGPPTQLPPPADEGEAEPSIDPDALAAALPPFASPPAHPESHGPSPEAFASNEAAAALPSPAEEALGPADTARRPPKLPDLTDVKSPVVRCERIIDWIMEAVGASEVFIADAAGLPIAGAAEPETRLAAAGVVGSSVAHLAAAIPGNSSALFELHVGDGPFFQLIGFEVGSESYLVGFQRGTPLGFRQAHAVRLACRYALGVAAEPSYPRGDASYPLAQPEVEP